MTKTKATKTSDIKRSWHLINLEDQVLGRASTEIAQLLIGKSKSYYTNHLDCGDYVVAINAAKIRVSGKKTQQKLYRWHTGYPGGFRQKTFAQMIAKDPQKILISAVKGMLPKNKLRQKRLRRLKIFTDHHHPYADKLKSSSDSSVNKNSS